MLTLECALLAVFSVFGGSLLAGGQISPSLGWRFYLAVALPSLALGLQNATLRRVGGHTVRTTFVTGMLTDLAEAAVAYVFWARDRLAGPGLGVRAVLWLSFKDESLHRFALYSSIWLVYVIGAVAGTTADLRGSLHALALPVGVLLLVAVWNAVRPVLPPEPE
jgi:uncharacterized membrane protein YoaK (UPF0700 family)